MKIRERRAGCSQHNTCVPITQEEEKKKKDSRKINRDREGIEMEIQMLRYRQVSCSQTSSNIHKAKKKKKKLLSIQRTSSCP